MNRSQTTSNVNDGENFLEYGLNFDRYGTIFWTDFSCKNVFADEAFVLYRCTITFALLKPKLKLYNFNYYWKALTFAIRYEISLNIELVFVYGSGNIALLTVTIRIWNWIIFWNHYLSAKRKEYERIHQLYLYCHYNFFQTKNFIFRLRL